MTTEEIFKIGTWRDGWLLQFEVFSELFAEKVKISLSFDSHEPKDVISQEALETLKEFMALDKNHIERIREEVWQRCLAYCTNNHYVVEGIEPEIQLEDQLKSYGISSKEDALSQAQQSGVFISNDWGTGQRTFWLGISTAWDLNHEMNFIYVNGVLEEVE